MKHIAKKSMLSVAALSLAAGLSTPAAAGALDETFVQGAAVATRTVSYDRAELASAEGRARLERRIENAAEAVCGSTDYREAGGLSIASKNKSCIAQAIDAAMSQVGADRVATID